MIIIKSLEIRNYRIKHAHLQNLSDLNIIIGPNNCGKTSILNIISLLSQLSSVQIFACNECQNLALTIHISAIQCPLAPNDKYIPNKNEEFELSFSFNEEEVEKLVPGVLDIMREQIQTKCAHCVDDVNMRGANTPATEHISPFIHPDIIEEIRRLVLFCPEQRLDTYRGRNLPEYISDKKFSGAQGRRWDKFVRDLIEARLIDHNPYTLNLIKNVQGVEFETPLMQQGSGIRSLSCLAADIISEEKAKVVLIDEPELGLNPFVKQELLKFLLLESKPKQIFIATHDPTFVSPLLWKNDAVAVFFYSVIKEEFIKVDLNQSKHSPANFAGYLPHTTSLKDIHIYVEGESDVYIFQIFLRRYLKQRYRNWAELLNRIGIFHLAGDYWQHLLYTIPMPPYRCIVILDGEKRNDVEGILDKYNQMSEIVSKFEFADDIEQLRDVSRKRDIHPVYCLKQKCIEEYLNPKPDYDASDYNKKIDGPSIAEEMQKVPDEIERLLEIILKGQ